jgi:hypothetical protein
VGLEHMKAWLRLPVASSDASAARLAPTAANGS